MSVNLEQSAMLLALGEALRGRGSWAGETHIQKAGFLLQELLKAPLGVSFILYKHGPFSFELRDVLAAMEAERLIVWQPQPYPYGPTMTPGPLAPFLARAETPKKFKAEIDFVADRLASKKVVDLEKIATALYVTLDRGVPLARRAEELTFRKPHVPLPEAEQAIKDVDEIIDAAVDRGMIHKVAIANSGGFAIQR